VELRWQGTETGRLSASATAEWCALLKVLEIRSVRGDTGVALAIFPVETLLAGTYPIKLAAKAESTRPAAGFALRWAGQTFVRGFQGESGTVILERSPVGNMSGRMSAATRSATDTGALTVTGDFRDLAVRTSREGCVAGDTLDAPRIDTLIH
jgi:hypothetical protein